jgi:hypothetical protein
MCRMCGNPFNAPISIVPALPKNKREDGAPTVSKWEGKRLTRVCHPFPALRKFSTAHAKKYFRFVTYNLDHNNEKRKLDACKRRLRGSNGLVRLKPYIYACPKTAPASC